MTGPALNDFGVAPTSLPSFSAGGTDPQISRAMDEWRNQQDARKQMVDSLLLKMTLGKHTDPQTASDLVARAQKPPDDTRNPDVQDKLIGQAHFYGIENADKIPMTALQHMVSQRQAALPEADSHYTGEGVGLAAGNIATGTVQGGINLVTRVPFIGPVIANLGITRALNQKMYEWNEGMTADLNDEDKKRLAIDSFVGKQVAPLAAFGAMMKPLGALVDGAIGVAPAATGGNIIAKGAVIRDAIYRTALKMGATTGAMEMLNNQTTFAQKGSAVVGGTVLGGAIGGVSAFVGSLPIFAKRAADSFSTPFDRSGPVSDGPPPGAPLHPDYEVVPDVQRRLGSGQVGAEQMGGQAAPAEAGPSGIPGPGRVAGLLGPGGGPGEAIPVGGVGTTGALPPERGLPSPYQAPQVPEHPPEEAALYHHYSQMADGLAQENPELAASMRQVAQSFAPPETAQMPQQFDPRSIMSDYDMNQYMAAQAPKGVDTPTAAAAGVNLAKRAMIAESPALGDMVYQPRYDDLDVVKAQQASNPGAVQIVQGIGDEAKTIRQLTQAQVEGKLMPQNYRVVPITDPETGHIRNDLLVSDGMPITNKRVNQYKSFGMFEGQRALLAGGSDVEVVQPAPSGGFATVKIRNGDLQMLVPADDLLPGKTSEVLPSDLGIKTAPSLYNSFRNQVQFENAYHNSQAGYPQFGWLDPQASDLLPYQMESFLDQEGIHHPVLRASIKNYFNVQRLADFKATSPAEIEQMRSVNAIASARLSENKFLSNNGASLDEMASAKGMRWENYPGTAGGTLRNVYTQQDYPMSHEDAAKAFLKTYHYEAPDIIGHASVPAEVMELPPSEIHPGNNDWPHGTEENNLPVVVAHADHMTNLIQDLEDQHFNRPTEDSFSTELTPSFSTPSGGGGPPALTPPPPPPGTTPPGFNPPALPPSNPSLASQFATANRTQLWKAQQDMDGIFFRYFTPLRRASMKIEGDLQKAGVTSDLWSDLDGMETGKNQAHNAAKPWMEEADDIHSYFSNSDLRDGTVAKIEEIGDFNQKVTAMQRAGYSDAQITAQGRWRDFFDRAYDEFVAPPGQGGQRNGSRYVFNYVTRVRAAAGAGSENPWSDATSSLPPELQFMGDYMRTGNLSPRNMDMRVIVGSYIRAATTQKYMGDAWSSAVAKWSGSDFPPEAQPFQSLVLNTLNSFRTGMEPGYQLSVQGLRHALNTVGVPVTNDDVNGLWNPTLSLMYKAYLAFNPSLIIREGIRPLLAGTRIGFTPVIESYTKYATNAAARAEMTQRAIAGGWVEPGETPMIGGDLLSSRSDTPDNVQQFSNTGQTVRSLAQKSWDAVYDMMPRRFKTSAPGEGPLGAAGPVLDAATNITKILETGKIVAGDAGYNVASRAIAAYRAGPPSEDAMAQLLGDSHIRARPQPVIDKFTNMITDGRDEDAAQLMARESAADAGFRFGRVQGAVGTRGQDGRIAMALGNFSVQYANELLEGMSNGTTGDRVAFLARHAAVRGSLMAASAATGWNLSKYMWDHGLGWFGSPILNAAVAGVQDAHAVFERSTGAKLSPDDQSRITSLAKTAANPSSIVGGLVSSTGLARTLTGMESVSQSANPGEHFWQMLFTGESGNRTDIERFFQSLNVDPSTGGRLSGPPTAPMSPTTATPPAKGSGAQQ